MSLEESKKSNFRSFIYGERSTNPANFVKIGPVDIEINVLTEITEIFLKTAAKHKPSSPALLRKAGGLIVTLLDECSLGQWSCDDLAQR